MILDQLATAGQPLESAKKVLVMIHGRGATAENILSLGEYFDMKDFAFVAPQAPGATWYPYSFMAPLAQNEPSYSNSIQLLSEIHQELNKRGFEDEQIFWLGFSQGACLTLEYSSMKATKWGGVIAFTGGLIGETLDTSKYIGDFAGTEIFIGSSDPDPHVPVSRVHDSEAILKKLGADVTVEIYPGMPHTINEEEIGFAQKILAK